MRARTDDLTGLLNHGTFKDWLARSAADGEPFGLVMVDLDEFKTVNDTLGHQAGDRLLREIADAMRGAARDTRRRVPVRRRRVRRWSCRAATPSGSGGRGAHPRRGGERRRRRDGLACEGVLVAASIGTASFPVDGDTPEDVLLAADRACFVAKRGGRGRVATASEGLALAGEFTLSEPTPVDPPSVTAA